MRVYNQVLAYAWCHAQCSTSFIFWVDNNPKKWDAQSSSSSQDRRLKCLVSGGGADSSAASHQESLSITFPLLTAAITWASGQGMLT